MDKIELSFICTPQQSFELIQIFKEAKIKFSKKEERALAPELEIIKLAIEITASSIPIIMLILKKIQERNMLIEIESRYELAKRMLADMQPIYCESRKDSKDSSYYVFKTAKCRYFWEIDRGEIKLGPLGDRENACSV